jgi:hypothetical protein
MADRLIGAFHLELTEVAQALVTALGASCVLPLRRHFADKAAVLASGLDGSPCLVLQVPRVYDADCVCDEIVAALDVLLPAATRPRLCADGGSPYQPRPMPSGSRRWEK